MFKSESSQWSRKDLQHCVVALIRVVTSASMTHRLIEFCVHGVVGIILAVSVILWGM